MKKFIIALSVFFTAIFSLTSAIAAESFSVDPIQIMNSTKPAMSARGIVFVENVSAGVSIGWIRYSHIPTFNSDGSIAASDYWDWTKCSSWQDSSCPHKSGFTMEGKVILGTCINAQEIGCIEDFKIFNSFGAGKRLTYLGKSYGNYVDTPEDRTLGIPRSSSPAIYQDEDKNLYVVRAGLYVRINEKEEPTFNLDVDVTPVAKESQPSFGAPVVENQIEPRTGKRNVFVIPSPSECITTDVGVCYRQFAPKSENQYSVSVRVPRNLSGWIRGRVADAKFDVKLLNDKSQVLTVTAAPVKMPIAGGWVNYKDLPEKFIESIWPSGGYDSNPTASYFLVASPSQGERSIFEYSSWSPYLKDKALTTVSNWSFGTSIANSNQRCINNPGEISGFVASNAAVYSSQPPLWDQKSSTLTYKVAAPHFDENGKENAGTYTLAMPLSSIKCLYGQSNLPPSATVSIAYGSDVVEVATVTLKSDSGWIFFAANGFHYSNPDIVVKFAKSSAAPTPSVTPSATPVEPVAKKPPQPLKVQWCAKGHLKRKVTAVNPICPAGYKKIAAP